DGWLVDKDTKFSCNGNSTKPRNWSCTGDDKTFGDITYNSKVGNPPGSFVIAYGKLKTTLETSVIDLSNAEGASLNFDQAFYFVNNDEAIIEISIDGGANYVPLRVMHAKGSGIKAWLTAGSNVGNSTTSNYIFDQDNTSILLDDYLGESNLRIRFSFSGSGDKSTWALDN